MEIGAWTCSGRKTTHTEKKSVYTWFMWMLLMLLLMSWTAAVSCSSSTHRCVILETNTVQGVILPLLVAEWISWPLDSTANNRQRKNSVAEFLWCVTKIKVAVILTPSFSERFIFFFYSEGFCVECLRHLIAFFEKEKRKESFLCVIKGFYNAPTKPLLRMGVLREEW